MLRHLSDSIDAYLTAAMHPCAWAHGLLQATPGVDKVAAGLIHIVIVEDMARLARPSAWPRGALYFP
ncbi:hypothetical protein B0E41_19115 [Hydrogenophaga sp. A37]|nr:hypothetical protein B0E41_19115 [Hydrogenophaga sp. A37]